MNISAQHGRDKRRPQKRTGQHLAAQLVTVSLLNRSFRIVFRMDPPTFVFLNSVLLAHTYGLTK